MTETNVIYKLASLYTLSKVDFPLTTNSLCLFLLENKYTDYFTFQQGIAELLDDRYITREDVHDKTLYRITEEGRDALKLLKNELAPELRNEIDEYIIKNKFPMHEDISVLSNYYKQDINHYIAHLYIDEDKNRILEINIAASSADEAESICTNWKKSSEEIYPMLISSLLHK